MAIITWVSSDRRQERALVAERERQLAKLAHDRELADLTDLRALLDEAARVLHRGKVACPSVSRLIDTEDAEVWGEFHNTFEELLMARGQLEALSVRLSVRLGREHEITAAFLAADDAVTEMASGLVWFRPPGVHADRDEFRNDTDSGAERERVAKARAALFRHRREFETAVIAVAGSRIYP
ncbi:MAG: hypothetical protein ACR2H2_08655 [Solirubrobacteraceae bacterium]